MRSETLNHHHSSVKSAAASAAASGKDSPLRSKTLTNNKSHSSADPILPAFDKISSTLTPFPGECSGGAMKVDSQSHGGDNEQGLYCNVEEELVNYENAPGTHRIYHQPVSDSSKRIDVQVGSADVDSNNEKMVFVQPMTHVSSNANKRPLNKVENIQLTSSQPTSSSVTSQRHGNLTDVMNISKQATVKEIPSTSMSSMVSATSPDRKSSYNNAVRNSADEPNHNTLPLQFVTSSVKMTSPQKAIIRQCSMEEANLGNPSTTASKNLSESVCESRADAELSVPNNLVNSRINRQLSKSAVEASSGDNSSSIEDESRLSTSSLSDGNRPSSVSSSSLASLSNVVAPCGSTEDLDAADNEVFPLIAESPLHQTSSADVETTSSAEPLALPSSVLPSTDGGGTSDLMRDITKSLDEALLSMNEVMSKTPVPPAKDTYSSTGEVLDSPAKSPSDSSVDKSKEISEVTNNDGSTSSNLISYNDGRIVFNLGDNDSIVSKVSFPHIMLI